MATVLEKTGKTVDEAYQAALAELGVSKDCTELEILSEPSKGFLGLIGSKMAKIRVTVKANDEDIENIADPYRKAEDFLVNIFKAMSIDVKIVKQEQEGSCLFNIEGENMGILIGKHGQTLDALQYLANLTANHGNDEEKVHVIIDIEDYRKRREEALYNLAMRLADKVRHTKNKVVLEPMNRHERKVMHIALQEEPGIITYSSGDEPYRKVVIALKD